MKTIANSNIDLQLYASNKHIFESLCTFFPPEKFVKCGINPKLYVKNNLHKLDPVVLVQSGCEYLVPFILQVAPSRCTLDLFHTVMAAGNTHLLRTIHTIYKSILPETTIGDAIMYGGHLEIVKTMYELGYPLTKNALLLAIDKGYLQIVKFIHEKSMLGSNTRIITRDYQHAMEWACAAGHLDIVKFLVSLDITGINYPEAVIEAHMFEHRDIVEYLNSLGHYCPGYCYTCYRNSMYKIIPISILMASITCIVIGSTINKRSH